MRPANNAGAFAAATPLLFIITRTLSLPPTLALGVVLPNADHVQPPSTIAAAIAASQ
jgi:hypothetical protein